MSRSKKKGYYISESLLALVNSNKFENMRDVKVWSRSSTILPEFIDKFCYIYNGRQFIKRKISVEMVVKKFGEFAFNRKIYQYKKKTR